MILKIRSSITILFILFLQVQGFTQNMLESLDYSEICISGVHLGDNVLNIKCMHDTPDSVIHYQSDIIEADSARYFYFGKSFLEVYKNKILRFEIYDEGLKCLNPLVKYGEPIDNFLERYSNLEFKKYKPNENKSTWIYSHWVNEFDGALLIFAENKKIIKVEFHVPY